MLTLKEFRSAIKFIIKQNNKQTIFMRALDTLSPGNYNDCFLYCDYETEYVKMIKKAIGLPDNNDILEYWLYDCEYGKKAGNILAIDDKEVDISTIENLYDYLISEAE